MNGNNQGDRNDDYSPGELPHTAYTITKKQKANAQLTAQAETQLYPIMDNDIGGAANMNAQIAAIKQQQNNGDGAAASSEKEEVSDGVGAVSSDSLTNLSERDTNNSNRDVEDNISTTNSEDHHHEENNEHDQQQPLNEPTYPPTTIYNPHNLTWDELEMFLYEWEEEASESVSEYFDMRIIGNIRSGEYDDDYWNKGEDEDEEEEDEDEEAKKSSSSKGWLSRLKNTATHNAHDADGGGSRTTVEFKKGPTRYLNLTDDAAHVVEFYAPW